MFTIIVVAVLVSVGLDLLADLRAETEHQKELTKEIARLRGQTSIGLRELAEAVERVESAVTSDIVVAYDLGQQSARY